LHTHIPIVTFFISSVYFEPVPVNRCVVTGNETSGFAYVRLLVVLIATLFSFFDEGEKQAIFVLSDGVVSFSLIGHIGFVDIKEK